MNKDGVGTRKGKKIQVFDVVLSFMLCILALTFLYPLWYVFVAALSGPLEVIKNPMIFIPKSITLYNFQMLLSSTTIWLGYSNTLFYVFLGTFINVACTITVAYALSQNELPFKKQFNFLIVFTMFFSGGMIPSFLIVRGLGMLNTVWAMVIPGAISTWNLMVTRTYLRQQIPHDLIEAAEIDGSGEYMTFFRIVLPLSMPIIAVIMLFYASGHWNAFFNALLYLRDRQLYPLQMFLREMLIDNQSMGMMASESESERALFMITLKYAVMTVAILPLLILFPFVQKFFVKGVMIGALKG